MKSKDTKLWYYSSFLAPSPHLHLGVVCLFKWETRPFSAKPRHIFAYVAMLLDRFPALGPSCFTDIGKTILATIIESHSWKGPEQSSQTVPSSQMRRPSPEICPKCLRCSDSSVAEPGLDSIFTLEWSLCHVIVVFLTPSPTMASAFWSPPPTPPSLLLSSQS